MPRKRGVDRLAKSFADSRALWIEGTDIRRTESAHRRPLQMRRIVEISRVSLTSRLRVKCSWHTLALNHGPRSQHVEGLSALWSARSSWFRICALPGRRPWRTKHAQHRPDRALRALSMKPPAWRKRSSRSAPQTDDPLLPGFYAPRFGATPAEFDKRIARELRTSPATKATTRCSGISAAFMPASSTSARSSRASPNVPVYLLHSLGEMDGGTRDSAARHT